MDRLKKKKNQRGAVLIYAILMITVLSVLGISLVSLSMSAIQMTDMSKRKSDAFYKADSVVGELAWSIETFAQKNREDTSEYISITYISSDEWKTFVSSLKSSCTDDEGNLDKKKFVKGKKDKLQEVFKTNYFNGFETYLNGIKAEIGNNNGKIKIIDTANGISLESLNWEVKKVGAIPERLSIVAVTSGTSKDINKKMRLELLVDDEYLEIDESNMVKILDIYENQILDNAITANGSIYVRKGSLKIDGNVYAYGEYPEVSGFIESQDMGGIVSGTSTSNGQIVITKDAYTRSNIQTLGSGSSIEIEKNAYADSIITSQSSNDSRIEIGENLIVYDDIILNGDRSSIVVANDIWGVLDGDPSGGHHSDASSSMVSNVWDQSATIKASKIMLGGVSYISIHDSNNKFYQKGESASPSKYSYFYQEPLEYENGYSYFKEYKNKDETESYEMVEYIPGTAESPQSEVKFKMDHFLNYGFENRERFENDSAKSIIKIGKDSDNSDDKISGSYVLGAVVANGLFYNPDSINFSGKILDHASFAMDVIPKLKEIYLKTHMLKTRNYASNENADNRLGSFIDLSFINPTKTFSNDYSQDKAMILESSNILIKDGQINGHPISKGIIYSGGNIEIEGNFSFEGIIICEGNIILESGKVDIKGNKKLILDMAVDGISDYDNIPSSSLYNFIRLGEGAVLELDDSLGSDYNLLRLVFRKLNSPIEQRLKINDLDISKTLVIIKAWNEQ